MKFLSKLLLKADPKPVTFPEVNFTYTKPPGLTDEQCGSLPCFRTNSMAVSCWKLSMRDRLLVLLKGNVWLMVMMDGHPPVCVTPESPFPPAAGKTAADPVDRLIRVIMAVAALGIAIGTVVAWLIFTVFRLP